MSQQVQSDESPGAAEVWVRFMAAALSAAPHAPADKLGTTADEALAEYRQRLATGRFDLRGGMNESGAVGGATATPFEPRIKGDRVTYEPTADAPTDQEVDSPFKPPRQ